MHENVSGRGATPAWLLRSFVDSMLAIGAQATEDQLSLTGEKLLFRWCSQRRSVHNSRYLASLITHIDELSDTCHNASVLRVVAWYLGAVEPVSVYLDDVVFARRIADCQAYLSESATELGVPAGTVERLKELVSLALHHTTSLSELDGAVLIDADLAVLAGTPQEYKQFRQQIRLEHSELSDFEYQVARRRFIKCLLQRKILFKSPVGAHWEPTARQNLEAELENLNAGLAVLDPQGLSDADWVPAEETDLSSTSTTVFKRSFLVIPQAEALEETTCALPRYVVTAPTAEAETGDYSSLEFEPQVSERGVPGAVVRRLSAKELARQAAKRKQN